MDEPIHLSNDDLCVASLVPEYRLRCAGCGEEWTYLGDPRGLALFKDHDLGVEAGRCGPIRVVEDAK